MNGNLSTPQMGMGSATNKLGAMPLKPKYDGPPPTEPKANQGVMQPGKNIRIPKPGFY